MKGSKGLFFSSSVVLRSRQPAVFDLFFKDGKYCPSSLLSSWHSRNLNHLTHVERRALTCLTVSK